MHGIKIDFPKYVDRLQLKERIYLAQAKIAKKTTY